MAQFILKLDSRSGWEVRITSLTLCYPEKDPQYPCIRGWVSCRYDLGIGEDINLFLLAYHFLSTGVLQYPRVISFKTYRGYVKPRIIPNAIYNVVFV
jgi:hypothetical protein